MAIVHVSRTLRVFDGRKEISISSNQLRNSPLKVSSIDNSLDNNSWRIRVVEHAPIPNAHSVPIGTTCKRLDVQVVELGCERSKSIRDVPTLTRWNCLEITLSALGKCDLSRQDYSSFSRSARTSSRGRPRLPLAISCSARFMERAY